MERSTRHAVAGEAYADGLDCERWSGDRLGLRHRAEVGEAGGPAEDPGAWIAETIETQIIPRLLLAHRSGGAALAPSGAGLAQPPRPTDEDTTELAQLVLGQVPTAGLDYVRDMRRSGVALEAIFLELLAPAARRLGALWEADLCSFADVTVGLWRLQQVVHELSPAFHAGAPLAMQSRRAILVPVPGSQHTLGLFMVAEFFRRAGWYVWGDAMVSAREIGEAVRREWFDVLGLSIGSETHLDVLARLIAEMRGASHNPALAVLVGGPIVLADPSVVARVGADGTATDAPDAVGQAERLVSARAARAG